MSNAHRKHIPIGVKLNSCLLLLGFSEEQINGGDIEWDHQPALALRIFDEGLGQLVPHPNDPRYIRPLSKAIHAVKTSGAPATTAGSDIHLIAKGKRLTKAQEDTRRAMLAKAGRAEKPEKRSRWPKRGFR